MSLPATTPDVPTATRAARAFLAALGWALATGSTLGLSWAITCVVTASALGIAMPLDRSSEPVARTLALAALGAAYGGLAGVFVGLCRQSGERARAVLILSTGGVLFGALAGGLSVLVAVVVDPFDPLLSSSLAMTVVGFTAGLCGNVVSHRAERPEEPPDEDTEDDAPAVKIEWLLREPKWHWRPPRPLLRVLPVLAVAVGALIGAAFSRSPVALVALGLLGLAVSWVLYRQERRLDAIEQHRRRGA